ncbi:CRP-like cAMP-binding protein [Mucilaginibacter gracilis]|uniref:CRP-like cAMP-binding protein n=1 Tax=Mucilaginibacter gracilis TaxID=423350 RepID=A0A495J7D9_9SPHI|nr:Crp/Fnr family transcriptional regulator [Mucilaginibacter gracilis]RKR84651.1 CRP-like cAMP-binding protein [Mucilaginibacter gracilis]
MNDVSPLVNYVTRELPLTKTEEDFFATLLRVKKVKRKQFIDQPDFVSSYRNYVVKGALRAYILGDDGQEHTIALAVEGGFIGDHGSFLSQEPATLFVEAIEDSEVIQISYENEQRLLETVPKFHSYFRLKTLHVAVNIQKRVLSNISQSAEKRYEQFAKNYPQLLQRFPLYMIASYLGMTREFLSKIRNNNT